MSNDNDHLPSPTFADLLKRRTELSMRKYSPEAVLTVLMELEEGGSVRETCRRLGVKLGTLYDWIDRDDTHREAWRKSRERAATTAILDALDAARRLQTAEHLSELLKAAGGDTKILAQKISATIKAIAQMVSIARRLSPAEYDISGQIAVKDRGPARVQIAVVSHSPTREAQVTATGQVDVIEHDDQGDDGWSLVEGAVKRGATSPGGAAAHRDKRGKAQPGKRQNPGARGAGRHRPRRQE